MPLVSTGTGSAEILLLSFRGGIIAIIVIGSLVMVALLAGIILAVRRRRAVIV